MRTRIGIIAGIVATLATAAFAADAPKKLAVLPFVGGDDAERALADKMRFAVSQKLSNDAQWAGKGGKFQRLDNVDVEQAVSALGFTWGASADLPADDDVLKVMQTLSLDDAVAGGVKGRTLSLKLYEGGALAKTAQIEIPPNSESPRLAIEKILTDLTGAQFAHIRQIEADHSDPAAEKRFAERPNLVPDGDFERAAHSGGQAATDWHAILAADDHAPPLISAFQAQKLPEDKVAIVPKSFAGIPAQTPADNAGYCLMMRLSKNIAENNGLACVSTWIPVEQGKKYRFTVKYHSAGPVARLFLKGFAYKPDQYGGGTAKNDPEAVRREYYRAQVLPRPANTGWDLIEMDFTPESLKKTDPKIEWMRLDLWVYLKPGDIFFDDVVLKKLDP